MRPDELPAIRELPLFADLADENFAPLMQAAYLQTFPTQVQLITEGDPADFLHVVIEGGVELFAGNDGREISLRLVHPYGCFILAAALKDAVYLMSARTMERSRVLLIPSENVRCAFQRDAGFARALVIELSSDFRKAIKDLKNQKLRTGVERLANILLRFNSEQGGGETVTLPCDKRTLAALLGMTPENLSRTFGALKSYGVTVDGPTVRLTKLDDLKTLAKPTPLIDDRAI
jgi:CRP/FNR family transcriptional activator FtrB